MAEKDLRVPLNFRLRESVIEGYDELGYEYRLDRTAVIRAHLTVAARHQDEVRAVLAQMVEVR